MSAQETSDDKHEPDLYPEEEISQGDWMRPQVDIKEVQVITGEENEDIFWQHRAKLYRWSKEKASWIQRGLGDAKLLKHKQTSKIRFLLRQEKTLKIVANHYVYQRDKLCQIQPHACNDKIYVWTVIDSSEDEPRLEQFALKLGQVETANEFKEKFLEAVEINSEVICPTEPSKEKETSETLSTDNPSKEEPAKSAEQVATETKPSVHDPAKAKEEEDKKAS